MAWHNGNEILLSVSKLGYSHDIHSLFKKSSALALLPFDGCSSSAICLVVVASCYCKHLVHTSLACEYPAYFCRVTRGGQIEATSVAGTIP